MPGGRTVDLKTKLLTLFVIVTNVVGNVLMSWGMKHQNAQLGLSPITYIRLIFSPWVLLGTMLLIVWLVSRMTLLGWADLSYVLPVTAIGYVLIALVGRYFLGEEISYRGWAGTLLIVAGTTLVGLTKPNTTDPEQGR